jgi:hypothetical protein
MVTWKSEYFSKNNRTNHSRENQQHLIAEFMDAWGSKDTFSRDNFPFTLLRHKDTSMILAENLLSPEDGNVEIQATDSNHEARSLFAHRSVLTKKCNYYKTGHHLSKPI